MTKMGRFLKSNMITTVTVTIDVDRHGRTFFFVKKYVGMCVCGLVSLICLFIAC